MNKWDNIWSHEKSRSDPTSTSHWVLTNLRVLSFDHQSEIQPGTPGMTYISII